MVQLKPVFHFNRTVAFPFVRKKNATVRYDTVEVENQLNP
jgi:hypothetical protein